MKDIHPGIHGVLIWFTDGLKMNKGNGAEVFGWGRRLSSNFGQHSTVFRAEIFTIMASTLKSINKNYRNRYISTFSDCQATLRVLEASEVNSKWFGNVMIPWKKWAQHNVVELVWVLNIEESTANKMADNLAKEGSFSSFICPTPRLGLY